MSNIGSNEGGWRDVVWPLDADTIRFVAEKLGHLELPCLGNVDEMRTIGLALMRCGPPVGWLGALLLIGSNRPRVLEDRNRAVSARDGGTAHAAVSRDCSATSPGSAP